MAAFRRRPRFAREKELALDDVAAEAAGGGARVKPPKLLVTGTYNGTAFDDNQYSAPPGSLEEEILATTNYDDDAADSRKIATEILEEGPTRMPPKQQVEHRGR